MRLPNIVIPLFVIVALLGGYALRAAFTQPTTNVAFDKGAGVQAMFTVDGLKCKGTAAFFTSLYEDVPGILGIETFATEHKAIITYDPDIITTDRITEIMEDRIPLDDGSHIQAFKCLAVE